MRIVAVSVKRIPSYSDLLATREWLLEGDVGAEA